MTRPASFWVGVLGVLAWFAGTARAGDDLSGAPAITLRVAGSRDEARSMRETLADLLSRVGIDIVPEPGAGRAVLVDVTVDLSGTPFVELTAAHPPVTICRRPLDAKVSRDVLIETAAQVVYTAVETRARTQGLIAATADPLAPSSPEPPNAAPSPAGPIAPIPTDGRGDLRAQAAAPVRAASYGIDVAAIAETRIQHLDPSRPTAGGGLALTWASRRRVLGPALTAAVEVQRPVAAGDPATAAHLNIISVRLIPTVNAVARRWMALQIGPSLALDVSRGDAAVLSTGPAAPTPMMGGPTGGPPAGLAGGPGPVSGSTGGPAAGPPTGPGPVTGPTGGPPTGSTARSFSGVALSAGAFARWSIRIGRHAQLFAAADVEHRLSYAESSRPISGQGPNAVGAAAPGPSTWRSSLLAGIAFTVAGTSLPRD
ncbi:MAG: hypothetical protein ACJ8F1_24615 [Polyangia bacterium]